MSDDKTVLTEQQVADEQLVGWNFADDSLVATFATGDFATGLALVNRIGGLAEETNHHPDLELGYPRVGVRLSSHDAGGVTGRDARMARSISELAAAEGVGPEQPPE